MKSYEIVDLLAKELGYNRFCGTIAAKNTSHKLNSQEECEMADVLASNNLTLFKEDALKLLSKIIGGIAEEKDLFNLENVKQYVEEELKYLEESHGKLKTSSENLIFEEITNPIMSLEI